MQSNVPASRSNAAQSASTRPGRGAPPTATCIRAPPAFLPGSPSEPYSPAHASCRPSEARGRRADRAHALPGRSEDRRHLRAQGHRSVPRREHRGGGAGGGQRLAGRFSGPGPRGRRARDPSPRERLRFRAQGGNRGGTRSLHRDGRCRRQLFLRACAAVPRAAPRGRRAGDGLALSRRDPRRRNAFPAPRARQSRADLDPESVLRRGHHRRVLRTARVLARLHPEASAPGAGHGVRHRDGGARRAAEDPDRGSAHQSQAGRTGPQVALAHLARRMAHAAVHAALQPALAVRRPRRRGPGAGPRADGIRRGGPSGGLREDPAHALRPVGQRAGHPGPSSDAPRRLREDGVRAGRYRAEPAGRTADRRVPAGDSASGRRSSGFRRVGDRRPHPLALDPLAWRRVGRGDHQPRHHGRYTARARGGGRVGEQQAGALPVRIASWMRLPIGAAPAMAISAVALGALSLMLAQPLPSGGPVAPHVFEYLFSRNEPQAAWLAIAVVLASAALARWGRVPGSVVSRLTADPRAFVAGVTLVLAAAALLVYRAHPLSMDEVAPLFQARVFARGRLAGQVPPELMPRLVPPFRWFIETAPSGAMLSAYWPGFALLLTPFGWMVFWWRLTPL